MDRPNPDGFKGGREDFTFVRTLDGHISQSADKSDDFDARRNARTVDDADLSGTNYRTKQ